jgi:hypothetical protein
MRKLILAFILIFLLGLLVGYIPTLASPGPGKPNPGHTASEIGGDTDAERTFNSTGKYTFLGNLDVRGNYLYLGGKGSYLYADSNNFVISLPSGNGQFHFKDKDGNIRVTISNDGTINAKSFKTRNQICPSGWSCEVNTWDIAAQSIRAYGNIIVDSGKALTSETGDLIIDAHSTGFGTVYMYDDVRISGSLNVGGKGSFSGADAWDNFVTSKTGYGDTIGIGGDSAGDDVDIRINSPSTRNNVAFWNSNLNLFANIKANSADLAGHLDVEGRMKTKKGALYGAVSIQTTFNMSSSGDNRWQEATCPDYYAMWGFQVYASSYWDGPIRITCVYLGPTVFSYYMTSSWTNPTSQGDNQLHVATCPDGTIATGVKAYATTYLDYGLSLRCTDLAWGVSKNIAEWGYNSPPKQINADNQDQQVWCPPGTYIDHIEVWASSYLDYQLDVRCNYLSW